MCELEYALSVGWADDAMSNADEVKHDLDPWDPDSEDDGLTDGQEHNWLTHVPVDTGYTARHEVRHDLTLDLDPAKNDTDGDGYWDGWLGGLDFGRHEFVFCTPRLPPHPATVSIHRSDTTPTTHTGAFSAPK